MLYNLLKTNSTIVKITKIQRSLVDAEVIGFWCSVNSNLGAKDKIQSVVDWLHGLGIGFDAFEDKDSYERFRIMIKV